MSWERECTLLRIVDRSVNGNFIISSGGITAVVYLLVSLLYKKKMV